jgi:hypothetical protein
MLLTHIGPTRRCLIDPLAEPASGAVTKAVNKAMMGLGSRSIVRAQSSEVGRMSGRLHCLTQGHLDRLMFPFKESAWDAEKARPDTILIIANLDASCFL